MKAIDKIKEQFENSKKKTLEKSKEMIEKEALKSAYDSYFHALNVIKGRFELGEKIISKNAYYSYSYALNVLQGRFELGEEVISKNAEYSIKYGKDILKLS